MFGIMTNTMFFLVSTKRSLVENVYSQPKILKNMALLSVLKKKYQSNPALQEQEVIIEQIPISPLGQ